MINMILLTSVVKLVINKPFLFHYSRPSSWPHLHHYTATCIILSWRSQQVWREQWSSSWLRPLLWYYLCCCWFVYVIYDDDKFNFIFVMMIFTNQYLNHVTKFDALYYTFKSCFMEAESLGTRLGQDSVSEVCISSVLSSYLIKYNYFLSFKVLL